MRACIILENAALLLTKHRDGVMLSLLETQRAFRAPLTHTQKVLLGEQSEIVVMTSLFVPDTGSLHTCLGS